MRDMYANKKIKKRGKNEREKRTLTQTHTEELRTVVLGITLLDSLLFESVF